MPRRSKIRRPPCDMRERAVAAQRASRLRARRARRSSGRFARSRAQACRRRARRRRWRRHAADFDQVSGIMKAEVRTAHRSCDLSVRHVILSSGAAGRFDVGDGLRRGGREVLVAGCRDHHVVLDAHADVPERLGHVLGGTNVGAGLDGQAPCPAAASATRPSPGKGRRRARPCRASARRDACRTACSSASRARRRAFPRTARDRCSPARARAPRPCDSRGSRRPA